jgi:predicted ribosome-associated RNA-binding protein Tma20
MLLLLISRYLFWRITGQLDELILIVHRHPILFKTEKLPLLEIRYALKLVLNSDQVMVDGSTREVL